MSFLSFRVRGIYTAETMFVFSCLAVWLQEDKTAVSDSEIDGTCVLSMSTDVSFIDACRLRAPPVEQDQAVGC